jgi:hypothetical protein
MGRLPTRRLTFYAGTAANAALWLLVLAGPLGALHTPSAAQGGPVLAASVCALVGTAAVGVVLFDRVPARPDLAPRVLSTFALSMLTYTLVYWAGKSAVADVLGIPDAAQWGVRALVVAVVAVGLGRSRLPRRQQVVAAAVAIVPTCLMSALDLVLLGVAGVLGGLGTMAVRSGRLRTFGWLLGSATLGTVVLSGVALAQLPIGHPLWLAQSALVALVIVVQARNLRVLALLADHGHRSPAIGSAAILTSEGILG